MNKPGPLHKLKLHTELQEMCLPSRCSTDHVTAIRWQGDCKTYNATIDGTHLNMLPYKQLGVRKLYAKADKKCEFYGHLLGMQIDTIQLQRFLTERKGSKGLHSSNVLKSLFYAY
jgi:hypothetical protein